MTMTLIVAKPVAENIEAELQELQHVLTTLTARPAQVAYSTFVETVVNPKESIQLTTIQQLRHPFSPFRLKQELQEEDIIIVYSDRNGLTVIAGSEATLAQACTKLGMLLREKSTASHDNRPHLEELYWTGSLLLNGQPIVA
ncbi:MAG: hypothetical protein IKE34_09180 [Paenibacillus sp.]|nr:hypothetical protein [Paenibacillus sp.]